MGVRFTSAVHEDAAKTAFAIDIPRDGNVVPLTFVKIKLGPAVTRLRYSENQSGVVLLM